ncbi:membrane protein [Desulfolithobacter dissulfuricans]|uniref:Membrane protein n=1 Tax=Desulfolithobacter dissulfuricans TaxID=2795293 RepID=A0A915U1I7_9BACT|nr:mechanosensitive ion channel domain-containing protein [Desulfolithobacter dissulfuricans]BCO09708.1 membrane protein [Desulfolithobacter dissulfuricans]
MTDTTIIAWLGQMGVREETAILLAYVIIACGVLLITVLATWLTRRILVRMVIKIIQETGPSWDDALVHNQVFHKLSWYVPMVILYLAQDLLLATGHMVTDIIRRLIMAGFVIVTIRCTTATLGAINDIYSSLRRKRGSTIRGYIDAARIVTYVLGFIFLIAILTNRSPWGLLSVLGGLTAVTMLVFKDSILGFVASIQLTGNDLVRVGDWIESPEHGADGDVIDISIHAVRVQNWDKTITSIPTYALISKSFKNWRGMQESGGRRIKRQINIDMTSIRFISDQELEDFARIQLISGYVRNKQKEIEEYNQAHGVDTSVVINGRRQTNIGIFRAYIIAYLKQHPKINRNMTFLVRHLQPGPEGLPIQIYVFSSDKVWANYEAIQADIFDHLLAAVEQFDLRVFQNPSGWDFRRLWGRARTNSEED